MKTIIITAMVASICMSELSAQFKLLVEHTGQFGGSFPDGILVDSGTSPSVIDIDCGSGFNSSAVRWGKGNVLDWYIDGGFVDKDMGIGKMGFGDYITLGFSSGEVTVPGMLSKGGGSFKIDHPLYPSTKYLYHSFVESPDMMNVYNGNITTDAKGKAIVVLPVYFEALNITYRYQLTAIGQYAELYVSEEIVDNRFSIQSNLPNVKVSWQVTGVRNDVFAQNNRIIPEVDKTEAEKNTFLHPDYFEQEDIRPINPSTQAK